MTDPWCPPPRLNGSARRILVTLTGGLPEAVLACGFLEGLRMRHPKAEILVLTPIHHARALRNHPALSRVVPIPEGLELRLGLQAWTEPPLLQLLSAIRGLGCDLALAPSPRRSCLGDLAILATGAPIRVGWHTPVSWAEHDADADGWDHFYTHLTAADGDPADESGGFERFAHVLGLDAGARDKVWPEDPKARKAFDQVMANLRPKPPGWLGLWCSPGGDATGSTDWAQALRPVLRERSLGLMLLGPGGVREALVHPQRWVGLPLMDLREVREASEILEALNRCRAVVGGAGPWVHLCASRRVPHLTLSTGSALERFAPRSPLATLIHQPVSGAVPSEAVTQALRLALDRPGDRPRLMISPHEGPAFNAERILASNAFERLAFVPDSAPDQQSAASIQN